MKLEELTTHPFKALHLLAATPEQKGRGIGLLDFIFEAAPLNPSNAPFEAFKRSV